MKVSDVDLILKNRSLSQLARSYTVGWRNWDFLGLGDVILLLGRTYLQVRKCLASFYITSYRFLIVLLEGPCFCMRPVSFSGNVGAVSGGCCLVLAAGRLV